MCDICPLQQTTGAAAEKNARTGLFCCRYMHVPWVCTCSDQDLHSADSSRCRDRHATHITLCPNAKRQWRCTATWGWWRDADGCTIDGLCNVALRSRARFLRQAVWHTSSVYCGSAARSAVLGRVRPAGRWFLRGRGRCRGCRRRCFVCRGLVSPLALRVLTRLVRLTHGLLTRL